MVDLVVRLVERSLVHYDDSSGRYRLLETLRQYAADRLAEAAESDAARDRHASFYAALAAGTDPYREGSGRAYVERLTVELDNLRAAAGWLGDQGRGDDLLGLCRNLFMFLVMTAPAEALGWYRRALDCSPDLAAQERVDVLGELGLLAMNTGDYDGEGSGEPSISLAATAGLLHSPWAWYARTLALHVTADFDGGQKAAETTIEVADQRNEPFCAAMAMATIAGFLARAGELDRSAQLAADTIGRASQLSDIGQRHHVITTAAISYVNYRAEPDFETAMTVLIANPLDPESVQPVIGLFRDLVSGLAHLGLGHTGPAVYHLTRSLRLTDRTGHYTALDQIARALAVAYAQAGRHTVAAQLVGYTRAQLASFRTVMPIDHWFDQRLVAAAAALGTADWTRATETGAQLDRRGFMRLITRAEQDLLDPLTIDED